MIESKKIHTHRGRLNLMPKIIKDNLSQKKPHYSNPAAPFSFGQHLPEEKENPLISASSEVPWQQKKTGYGNGRHTSLMLKFGGSQISVVRIREETSRLKQNRKSCGSTPTFLHDGCSKNLSWHFIPAHAEFHKNLSFLLLKRSEVILCN